MKPRQTVLLALLAGVWALPRAFAATEPSLSAADSCFWQAVELEGDAQEKELDHCIAMFEAVTPQSAEAHAELARALGQLAIHRGGKGKLELGKRIKAEADRALAEDPENALGHAVLGRWNFELADLSGLERSFGGILFGKIPDGSYEKAASELKRAITLDPKVIDFRMMLAQVLLKLGDRAEARAQLEAMPKLPLRHSADRATLEQGQELLKKLEK